MDEIVKVDRFRHIADLIRVAASPVPGLAREMRSSMVGREAFNGTKSLDEALELARKGWPDGMAYIEKMQAEIKRLTRGLVPVPQPEPNLSRGRVSVSRAILGHPKAFIKQVDHGRTRAAMMPKIITLVYNASVSGAISRDVIMRRGAAMIVACQTLERRNIRCNIELVFAIRNRIRANSPSAKRIEYRLRIKHANEHVSTSKLAFFLAHPSTPRRLLFSIVEHEPDATRALFGFGRDKGNYGLPSETDERGHIYLGRIASNTDWSEALTIAWLKKTLSDQGLVLREI